MYWLTARTGSDRSPMAPGSTTGAEADAEVGAGIALFDADADAAFPPTGAEVGADAAVAAMAPGAANAAQHAAISQAARR
ncbi:hypothetical protein [Roseateles sp.]|uniref:hypothetical protein n=1 Tax=Roseateles sp. TaxID=1971397 RepID=UPI002F3E227C